MPGRCFIGTSPFTRCVVHLFWVFLAWSPVAAWADGFSLLNFNTHGNSVSDWSTNSEQVRAIGRQMQFLRPDIITFQEIPYSQSWEMTNFVTAFLPGYHLAGNSGTDGYIRCVILSRFPITRSTKWLDGVSLAEYGNASRFTRDLFEAEVNVPGLSQPLHVFTTHLKSGQDAASSARRAAEAQVISNFFVTVFLPANPNRPYVLTGDMNEDVASPPSGTGNPFSSMVSGPTDLWMTKPLNPESGSERTFSIQAASLTRRYDYILPSGLLASNIVSSMVFRSDLAVCDIAPAQATDSVTSSDHLPVLMSFRDPYSASPPTSRIQRGDDGLCLSWDTVPGGFYRVEVSSDLLLWRTNATNFVALGPIGSVPVDPSDPHVFFRIRVGR
jgi:endonuclease/exonuclease/phosphatase family metal-dependent hydrolase